MRDLTDEGLRLRYGKSVNVKQNNLTVIKKSLEFQFKYNISTLYYILKLFYIDLNPPKKP